MDVVVTVPKAEWNEWIGEGDLPGDADFGNQYGFRVYGSEPDIDYGDRVYIVAHGKLRGWAPLTYLESHGPGCWEFVREGGAVACTIDAPIRGFRGWRYRWWKREDEKPFPDWRQPL